MVPIELKKGILNSIRYFLAPRDLFENIQNLEQALIQLKIEKEAQLKLSQRLLDDREKEIREKELLIDELKKELAEIRINAPAKIDAEKRKRQSENVHQLLNLKQLELFKILCEGEKNYAELLATARNRKLDIRDMSTLRVQMSRLNKKLEKETLYKIERIPRNNIYYFGVR